MKQEIKSGIKQWWLMVAALSMMLGCKPPEEHSASHGKDSGVRATDFPTNVTAYEVKGVLKEIRAEGWKALIEHEDIPGYMEAMTMLLDVKNANDLSEVRPGDSIRFRMLVTDSDGWIDRVKRIGTNVALATVSNAVSVAPGKSKLAFDEFKELAPGDPLPDCTLTNQLGQRIQLSEFKGSALAFTFIFTRCPFPTMCPRMNNNFGAAQRALAKAGTGTNWHLLSISIDPEWDTPARLATYAKTYRFDAAHWSFATGSAEDVRQLGERFGLLFYSKGGSIEHNIRTVVVDAGGLVQKIFTGNEWQPAELVEEVKKTIVTQP
jgi:protein SCO1/2